MKKLLCIILSVIAAISCMSFTAAAENVPFTFSASPESGKTDIVLPDNNNSYKATVAFSLVPKERTFGTDITIKAIKLVDGNKKTDVSSVLSASEKHISASDRAATRSIDVQFNSSQAGKIIVFELDWADSNGDRDPVVCQIETKSASPKVTIKVEPSKTSLTPGSELEIKYEVFNTGNVPLRYLAVSDKEVTALTKSDYVYFDRLSTSFFEVGASIEKTIKINPTKDVKISPIVSYSFNGKNYETIGEVTTVSVGDVIPELILSCDNYAVSTKGAMQKFNYTITNKHSELALNDVIVYDADTDNANVVYGPFSLEAGQSFSGSYQLPIEKSGFYKFKVKYRYADSNETKEVSVKTQKAIKLPNDVALKISSITPQTINQGDDVTFTLTVENGTSSMLQDLIISEENGLIDPVSLNIIIPAATETAPAKVNKDITLKATENATKLKFILTYKIDGEIATTKVSYDIVFGGTLNVPTDSPAPEAPKKSGIASVWIWVLVCVLVLLIIAAVIVILIILKNKRGGDTTPTSVKRKISDDDVFENDEDYDNYDDVIEDDVKIYKR